MCYYHWQICRQLLWAAPQWNRSAFFLAIVKYLQGSCWYTVSIKTVSAPERKLKIFWRLNHILCGKVKYLKHLLEIQMKYNVKEKGRKDVSKFLRQFIFALHKGMHCYHLPRLYKIIFEKDVAVRISRPCYEQWRRLWYSFY